MHAKYGMKYVSYDAEGMTKVNFCQRQTHRTKTIYPEFHSEGIHSFGIKNRSQQVEHIKVSNGMGPDVRKCMRLKSACHNLS